MSQPLKIKKSVIKNIIKECLVEILAEGLAANSKNLNETVILVDDTENNNFAQNKPSSAGFLKTLLGAAPPQSSNRIQESVRSAQNQPQRKTSVVPQQPKDIMSSIFADTAQTTLAQQENAERMGPVAGDAASLAVANSDPNNLFGADISGKWESLAFSKK